MKFLDQVKIFIKAGDGGSGSPSFRREKFIEFGGPDGGDGGKGGSVILTSERNLNTLIDYRYQQHFKAKRGEDGKGQNRTGRGGEDLILKVPIELAILHQLTGAVLLSSITYLNYSLFNKTTTFKNNQISGFGANIKIQGGTSNHIIKHNSFMSFRR